MKKLVTRIKQTLLLLLLLCLPAPSTMAQSEQPADGEPPTFLYDLKFDEEALESALFQILFSQTRFTIVGNRDVVVYAEIKARTEEDAIDQLAQQMDWLVTRRGTRYFVYVEGAEEELGERSINYMFKCRSVRAGDILQILEGKAPAGFPQPAQLRSSDGRGSSGGYGGYPASYNGSDSGPSDAYSGQVDDYSSGEFAPDDSFSPSNGPSEFGSPGDGSPGPSPTMPAPPGSLPPNPGGLPAPPGVLPSQSKRMSERAKAIRRASFTQDGANPEQMLLPPEDLEAIPNPDAAMKHVTANASDSPLPFKPGRGLHLPLGKVQYDAIPNLNTIMIRGKLADVRTAVEFLQTIDQPVPVVLVELLIVQFVHGDDFTWRYDVFNGQIAKGDAPKVTALGTTLPDTVNYGERAFGINAEGMGISATDGGGPMAFTAVGNLTASFRQNLKFLISKKQARIVTNPHIAVVSGNEGRIELNEEFNFTTSLVFPTAGTTNVGQPANLKAQTQLTVIPTVISAENIHMAVDTDLAAFVPNIINGATGVAKTLPDKRQSHIHTSVTLPEGDTIIIGGLVKEEATDARSKIPGANRLPVVGHLFKARSSTKQFTETVIYITPKTTMPQGYEDEYRKQIFEQMCRLQERGEDVTNEHRADDQRAFQIRQLNDEIDHLDWKDRMRQKMHRMRFWDRNGKATVDCPPEMQMTSPPTGQHHVPERMSPLEPTEKATDDVPVEEPMMLPPAAAFRSTLRGQSGNPGSSRGVYQATPTARR